VLQIFGLKACVFSDAREHLRADFGSLVKRPNIIAARRMRQNNVGASLGFNGVAFSKQSPENLGGFVLGQRLNGVKQRRL
jgi:hypothetical protein